MPLINHLVFPATPSAAWCLDERNLLTILYHRPSAEVDGWKRCLRAPLRDCCDPGWIPACMEMRWSVYILGRASCMWLNPSLQCWPPGFDHGFPKWAMRGAMVGARWTVTPCFNIEHRLGWCLHYLMLLSHAVVNFLSLQLSSICIVSAFSRINVLGSGFACGTQQPPRVPT